MSVQNRLESLRTRLLRLAEGLRFLAPLLIRLTVGLVFATNGWAKLHSLPDVTTFFESLGIPFPGANATLVASTELFGGLLILVGLGTRLAALPLAFTMIIAILTAKRADADGLVTLLGFQEWDYLVMFLVLPIIGPGALSLDALLARRFSRTDRNPLPRPRLRPNQPSNQTAG